LVAQNKISAVVCATDVERSPEFYEQKVGLTLSPETVPNHLLFDAGDGSTLLVYGRSSPSLADHTQVRFWCTNVVADVRELVGPGVELELVEFGDFKMVDHVLTTPVGRQRGSRIRMARSRSSSPPSSGAIAGHSVRQAIRATPAETLASSRARTATGRVIARSAVYRSSRRSARWL
jgi:hypothetical protein